MKFHSILFGFISVDNRLTMKKNPIHLIDGKSTVKQYLIETDEMVCYITDCYCYRFGNSLYHTNLRIDRFENILSNRLYFALIIKSNN